MFTESCINYTIRLIKAVINNTHVPEIPYDVFLDELYEYARIHKVEAIIYTALKRIDIKNDEALLKFENSYFTNVTIAMRQQYYINKIKENFESEGILCMPLKGNVIKSLYPDPYFRSLSDLDIYIGKGNAAHAREVMERIGFKTLEYNSEVLIHDTYSVSNVAVELHNALMPKIPYFKGVEVCPQIEQNIVKVEGFNFIHRMTNEDFYVFMIIHIAKHVKHNGIGLRGLIDVWLFLKEYENTLDLKRINRLLEESHLTHFNDCIVDVVNMWFKNEKPIFEYSSDFAYHIAMNGASGSAEHMISEEKYNDHKLGNKYRYYLETVFLPLPFMIDKYSVLKKFPVLLPFCWIHRIIKVIFSKHSRIKEMYTHFEKADMSLGEKTAKLKEKIGL